MKQCARCGKSGLILKLDENHLCKECAALAVVEAEAKRKKGMDDATAFIQDFAEHAVAAVGRTVLFPEMGRERIETIKKECRYIQDHIDDWKQVEFFADAFRALLEKDKYNHFVSPIFPHMTIFRPDNPGEYFAKLCKKASDMEVKAATAIRNTYDYSREYRVAGVTFDNGSRSRQAILKEIDEEKSPYDGPVHVRLKRAKFEGEDAVEVYANTELVGYISRSDLPWLLEHWGEYVSVRDFAIHGGEDGLSYGMDIKVGFKKRT